MKLELFLKTLKVRFTGPKSNWTTLRPFLNPPPPPPSTRSWWYIAINVFYAGTVLLSSNYLHREQKTFYSSWFGIIINKYRSTDSALVYSETSLCTNAENETIWRSRPLDLGEFERPRALGTTLGMRKGDRMWNMHTCTTTLYLESS